MKYYNSKIEDLKKELDVNLTSGLSSEEVLKRREQHGTNELVAKKKVPFIVMFLSQFKDVLIIILIIAAILSMFVGEMVDAIVIIAIVIVNSVIGVIQENKASKALEALKKMSSPFCKVIRDGVSQSIPSSELVPGDIVLLDAGDYIPADGRLIECVNLNIDESALTGESVPVTKEMKDIEGEVPLGDRLNSVFASTFVTTGRGIEIVTTTGMNTEVGSIASMLNNTQESMTPLQIKLDQIGKTIGIICIAICAVVFLFEAFLMGKPFAEVWSDALLSSLSLAVAAIPEGLSTVVLVVLSIGITEMAHAHAIIKKLPAVETLGSTSVICSDKTGTLTQNKMTVIELFVEDKVKTDLKEISKSEKEMLNYFALCSDAKISVVDGQEIRIGDPTELALVSANMNYGSIQAMERVGEIPFDSERKLMTVVVKTPEGKYISITKGAPDNIFNISNAMAIAGESNNSMANDALRVLAVGIKKYDKMPDVTSANLEKDLTFIGLVGMIDPAREEVKPAIALAKAASIKTVMITGDHITTAKAIARNLGIFDENDIALTVDELHAMSDEELDSKIENISVYARVQPSDKVRIVDAWQRKGNVVAMTGDGVNDSPALKKADIGCAMGITGTDVSKEAADMILTDDNFVTITKAVKLGRGIYDNIKKCVKYLLSCNIGEVFTIFVASVISAILVAMGKPDIGIPLLAIHLLWINLVTDSLPAFGLGMEKTDDEIMERKPRPKNESFFANGMGLSVLLEGIIIGIISLSAFLIGEYIWGSVTAGQTMAFLTLSLAQFFQSYNMKSSHTIFRKKTFNNKMLNIAFFVGFALTMIVIYVPGINNVFKTTPLNFTQFMTCFGLATTIVVVMEIAKLIKHNK